MQKHAHSKFVFELSKRLYSAVFKINLKEKISICECYEHHIQIITTTERATNLFRITTGKERLSR